MKTINEIHDLDTATFSDTTILIPAGANVSKVTVRVIDVITTSSGSDTFDVGVVGQLKRYGAGLAGAAGTERDQGPSDNQFFYGPAESIRLSAPGIETFLTGKISVAITHSAPKEGQSGITAVSPTAHIKTGEYTGDGTTGQVITGVGFRPKYVRIWRKFTGNGPMDIWETSPEIVSVASASVNINSTGVDQILNALTNFNDDGFTVDDAAIDADPNKLARGYYYLALG